MMVNKKLLGGKNLPEIFMVIVWFNMLQNPIDDHT